MTAAIPVTRLFVPIARMIRAFGRRVVAIVPPIAQNALFFGGLGSLVYGAWMIYRPLGPLAGGLFAIWIAFMISKERDGSR